MDIFKQASKMGLMFKSQRGNVPVSDLWILPLEEIDAIAQQSRKDVETESTSFITDVSDVSDEAKLGFDIVKAVITDRLFDRQKAVAAQATAQKKRRLLELIAQKQDDNLSEMSVEELIAMVNEL